MKQNEEYDYLAYSASSQDYTGLIPVGPVSEEELDHYEDLLPFLTPLVLKDIHKD